MAVLKDSLLEVNSRKIHQHLINCVTWNKSDEFQNSMNSLFKGLFPHCRRRRCLTSLMREIHSIEKKNQAGRIQNGNKPCLQMPQ